MNLINLSGRRVQLAFLAIAIVMMFGALVFGQTNDVRPLPRNQTIEREMSGKDTHLYKVELKKGEFLRIGVEQNGIDVVLKILDAEQRTLAEVDAPSGKKGFETLRYCVSRDGSHTVEVSVFDKKAEKGIYTIKRKFPITCPYVDTDVVYGHKDGLALTFDVYRPGSGANGAAILAFSSPAWLSYWARPYIAADMVLFALPKPALFDTLLEKGYTIISVRHGSAPRYTIPEIVSDVRQAVRFVRQNAKRLRVDADRLGVMGGSAGGHLALILGTSGDDGDPDAKKDLDRISSRVAAVVARVPPTDLRAWIREAPAEVLAALKNHPISKMSVKEAGDVSPLVHVTKDDAPSLVIMGGKDILVPARHGRWIDEAFRKNGVPRKLIVFPNEGHGFQKSEKNVATTIRETIAWFDRFLAKRKSTP